MAAGRTALSGCASRRMGSAWWLMASAARQGWSLARWTMVFSPGISAAVTMVNWDQSTERSKVMEAMRPRAMVERTVAPYHMPGRVMSSTYRARPVTLARPSLRMGDAPTMGPGSKRLPCHPTNRARHRLGQGGKAGRQDFRWVENVMLGEPQTNVILSGEITAEAATLYAYITRCWRRS